MNRANKKRRKALARQARESRHHIQALIAAGEQKPLQRFQVRDGMVTGSALVYSDEESE